jgi:hypothetical protein
MTEQNNNIRDAQASQRDAINKVARTSLREDHLLHCASCGRAKVEVALTHSAVRFTSL